LAVAARQTRTLPRTTAAGLAFGLGLTGPTLAWMSVIHVGAAIGLILVMSGWYALLGALLHLANRSRWWPLLGAGAWLAIEYAAARVPFGGFGWLRLGYTMIDGPLAGLLPLAGVAGTSLAVALAGNLIGWLIEERSRRRLIATTVSTLLIGTVAAAGDAIPPAPADKAATVGWVQGGAPGGGVYGLGPPRTITTNQARATNDLAADIAAGREPVPDFIVWPENSTDLDPGTDPHTRQLVDSALASIQKPILIGAILDGPGPDQRRTATQWTQPDGQVGPTYTKRSIVPFGEWIPYRDILLPLIAELRYVGRQSVAGTEPGLLDVRLADGTPVRIGVLACFDVAFDPVVHDLADAQLLIVQSSNAMYQGTAQIEQQFAITRARAAELRREIMAVTTSGISGLIDPYGRTTMRDTGPEAARGVEQLPIRTAATPATWLALPLEQAVAAVTTAWLLGLAVTRRRQKPPAEQATHALDHSRTQP
ncbi:MAG: apolipoprotein N-acyltransferase, partial [Propionibacteriaceae bacterium]|nr:apolipoprotein N-acyltransferase [Propionibacteriaceae bacterium]